MRFAYVVIPLLAACAVSAGMVRIPVLGGAPVVLRWVAVLAVSTVVLVVAHRALSRLLPLAALLELSIEFPGPAPSRYAVARDAGNPAKLREIVARAQRGDRLVNLNDAQAARDILALVAALRSHDSQTRGHSERVRVFTDLIAEQLHMNGEDREHLRWAALLHDVGKLDVPAAVLNKTEKLNESDWEFLRGHPSAGARIIEPLNNWLGGWADTVAQHHEKYDGTGYPRGVSGEQICQGARIVAVADAFDVMTAARSYRKPIGRAAALRELTDCSGTHFDPRVVRAMLAVSTPRLRLAMGPISWLGSAPFLAATQGAVTVAAQATAGVLVAGTIVASGPTASVGPSATPGPSATNTPAPSRDQDVGLTPSAEQSWLGASPSSSPNTKTFPSGKPTAPPGKPTAPPGKPTTSPTRKAHGKPTTSPSPKSHGKPTTSPSPKSHVKPTALSGHAKA